MALGVNYETQTGDIIPVVKYNAKAGRWFRSDREDRQTEETDITKNFSAMFDFENIETGHINFGTGKAPEFCMSVFDQPNPIPPTDKFKPGIRVIVKLGSACGGDIRELASCAKAFIRGVDVLHDLYLAGVKDHPGLLPIVVMKDIEAHVSEGKDSDGKPQKSTNYVPVFEITAWKKRPDDLVPMLRVWKGPAAPAAAPAQAAEGKPPATGSTKAPAPSTTDDDW